MASSSQLRRSIHRFGDCEFGGKTLCIDCAANGAREYSIGSEKQRRREHVDVKTIRVSAFFVHGKPIGNRELLAPVADFVVLFAEIDADDDGVVGVLFGECNEVGCLVTARRAPRCEEVQHDDHSAMRFKVKFRAVEDTNLQIDGTIEGQFDAVRAVHMDLGFVLAIVRERIRYGNPRERLEKFLSIHRKNVFRRK